MWIKTHVECDSKSEKKNINLGQGLPFPYEES